MVRVYYHPMCSNGLGKEKTESIKELYPDNEVELIDISTINPSRLEKYENDQKKYAVIYIYDFDIWTFC